MKTKLCFNDFVAVIVVAVIAIAIITLPHLLDAPAEYVKITTTDNELIFPLSQDKSVSIESNEYNLTVEISGETAFVTNSTCKDQVCVHSKKISRGGESIICAPAQVSIEIIGKGNNVDYAVG